MEEKKKTAKDERYVLGFLKRQREYKGLSQYDLAEVLGYSNSNFISMLERGRSKIPMAKIPDLVSALGLPNEFEAVLFKELYPDEWHLFRNAARKFPEFFDDPEIDLVEGLDRASKRLKGL